MREIDGILDFLEESGLLGPLQDTDRDPRVGTISATEQIVEVDWEAFITPRTFNRNGETEQGLSALEADILGGLGSARNGEDGWLRDNAIPSPWDTCAWYAPMQYSGPQWGIYIREDCLLRLAAEIGWFARGTPATAETAEYLWSAAVFVLYLHEAFHHKLEAFGIRLALADRATPDHYRRYDAAVYRPTFGSDENLEEALANADAFERIGKNPYKRVLPSKIRTAVRRWMRWRFDHRDPPGYRMAKDYLGANFASGADLLQTQVLEASLTPKSNPDHWQAGPHMLRSIFPITSDIYVIIPSGSTSSFPTTGFPYTVSVRETQRWLKKNGFTKLPDRGKGDHERYERADGTQVGLDAGGREVSRHIERTIAQALGVSQHDFRTAVRERQTL